MPHTNCPPDTVSSEFDLTRLGLNVLQSGISLTAPPRPKAGLQSFDFTQDCPELRRRAYASHLCYAEECSTQYQVAVKLPGSFRLTAGNRHLHRYCIFTGLLVETVPQSLRLSCASELTRKGIALL